MSGILLTQHEGVIIGPVAKILGYIMQGIFTLLEKMGIPNIGLAIIIFTLVIYLLLLPLTIKQQKFSKLSAKMNPELQAIREKYKNKKDSESMNAMNTETQAVYAKYGVSASGSCVQLIIQLPILWALYRVIYNMPAYVKQIKDAFYPLVEKLVELKGSTEMIQGFSNASMFKKQFENESFINGVSTYVQNTFIDVLNKASSSEWATVKSTFPELSRDVDNTLGLLNKYNFFLGINIADTPKYMLTSNWSKGAYLVAIAALIIPALAAITQWINVKLTPQAASQSSDPNDQQAAMAQSMKTMNLMMPLMSAFFCFTLPSGMGLYWIAGAVIRSIQQIAINRHIDKMDIDEVIKKNEAKAKKKIEKMGIRSEKLNAYANMNTKKVDTTMAQKAKMVSSSKKEINESFADSQGLYNVNAKPGSLAAKANMVRDYNERNNK